MGALKELLDDEHFQIAPQDKQAAILDAFFKSKIGSIPNITQLPPEVLDLTRQAFVKKNLPDPKARLLGGADASFVQGEPTITSPMLRPEEPLENQGQLFTGSTPLPTALKKAALGAVEKVVSPGLTDAVTSAAASAAADLPGPVVDATKKLAVAPLVPLLAPAAIATDESKKMARRGMILEGMGHPRSPGETAAEAALRGVLLGGVVDRSDLPQTLKGTLLDILEIGTTVDTMAGAGLKMGQLLKGAKVLENVAAAAPKMGIAAEDISLIKQAQDKVDGMIEAAKGGEIPPVAIKGMGAEEALPASALPGEMATPKDIGQFSLDNLSDPNVRGIMEGIEKIPDVRARMFAAKRGVLGDADVKLLANKFDLTPEKLRQLAPGTVLNSEGVSKAKSVIGSVEQSVQYLMGKFTAAEKAGDAAAKGAAVGDFQQLLVPVVDMLVKFRAVSSELGRAMRQLQIPSSQLSPIGQKLFQESLAGDKLLDMTQAEALLKRLATSGSSDIMKAIVQEIKPTFMDKAITLLTATKLTNPVTFVRNLTGNLSALGSSVAERAVAAPIDMVRSAISGAPRERFAGEVGAMGSGLKSGFADAKQAFWDAWKDEDLGVGRLTEALRKRAPVFTGIPGKFINAPFKMLTGTDNFFKTLLRRAELSAKAFRQATQEGQVGDALGQRVDELIQSPPKGWMQEIENHAKEFTYQTDLGSFAKKFDSLRNEGGGLPKVIIPFFKTPLNIGKFIIQRSPLGVASPRNIKAMLEGGGAASDALARLTVGSMLSAYFIKLAMEDKITGSGPDFKHKGERDLWFRSGKMPYSIKKGDKYYTYTGYEPFATPMGTAADIVDAYRKRGTVPTSTTVINMAMSLMQNLTEQPYFQGVSGLVDALRDENKMSKFGQNLASSAVPTGVSLAARLKDNTVRKPDSILQAVEARIPGLSQKVPPKRNVFGEPIVREGTFPIASSTVKSSPLINEAERLQQSEGYALPFRGNRINGRALTQDEFDQFQQIAGPIIKAKMEDLVGGDHYQGLKDPAKVRVWKKISELVGTKVADAMSVDVEMRALGLPPVSQMNLDPEIERTLRRKIKVRIDTKAYRDKHDPERTDAIKEKIADVLQYYGH